MGDEIAGNDIVAVVIPDFDASDKKNESLFSNMNRAKEHGRNQP